MATTDGRKTAPLYVETVDLGGGVRVDLDVDHVSMTIHGAQMFARPTSRQDANRMSIALKKASRRLQAIGSTLPEETGGAK